MSEENHGETLFVDVDHEEVLAEENKRLRLLIGELLDATGLNGAERAEWLDRNRLSESAVYPDDDDHETDLQNAEHMADWAARQ